MLPRLFSSQVTLTFPTRPAIRTFEWWATNRRMLAPKTITDYVYWVGCARKWMEQHGHDLDAATDRNLLDFFDTLRPTYSIRKNVRCALIAYFDYLAAMELRTGNPASSLPKLKRPKIVPKPLAHSQLPDFLRVAYADRRPVLPCMCVLYLNTGVRLTELCTRRQVDRVDRHLCVDVKGGGQRWVYLNDAAAEALDRWEAERELLYPQTSWMFPSPRFPERHISPEWVYEKIRQFGEKAGIDGCRPHRLRHTFATTLYAQTHDLLVVKEALGHTDIKNTLVYTQAHLFGVQEALQNLTFD